MDWERVVELTGGKEGAGGTFRDVHVWIRVHSSRFMDSLEVLVSAMTHNDTHQSLLWPRCQILLSRQGRTYCFSAPAIVQQINSTVTFWHSNIRGGCGM